MGLLEKKGSAEAEDSLIQEQSEKEEVCVRMNTSRLFLLDLKFCGMVYACVS